jgi:hypothetical protein
MIFHSLFYWSSRSRGGFPSVHRTHVAVVRRRAQNEATSPINEDMDRPLTKQWNVKSVPQKSDETCPFYSSRY